MPVRSSEAPKTRRAPKTDAPRKPRRHADLGALAEVCCSAVVRARLHHRHRLHTLSGRHDLRSRDEGCFWSGTSGGLIFWRPWYTMPPLAEHVARTQLSIEHGVGFWFPQPMACNRTAHAHDQQPLLASLRIPRTWRDPCCRRQNRFQSLPRRPVDSGFGEIFGVRGPPPVVEYPEVKLRHVQA